MMSDNVDNPHQKNIDVVMAILEEIRQRAEEEERRAADEGASHWLERPGIPEHNGVVSILGERGTGKTTLMRQVVEKLRKEKQDLVVGPITPMDFRETHSLFSYVLATLHDILFGGKNNKKNSDPCQPENKTELEQNLRDMRNYVARTIPISLKTLVQSGKPGEDFAYHYNTIQDKHLKAKERYPDLIAQILDHVSSQSGRTDRAKKRGLLVVVMDDCDLFPDLIRIVLDDIQRMCESPRVALLFTSNDAALFRAVGERLLDGKEMRTVQYMDRIGLSSPKLLEDETTLYIHKMLPLSQQIHLTWRADYGNRLNFKPLVDDPNLADFVLEEKREPRPSLYELMCSIPFSKPAYPHIPNLAALFAWSRLSENEISRGTQGNYLFTPFCELLPETPRGLFILYQMLARFYYAHASEKGKDGPENNRIEELIKILIDISLYGALPNQRKLLDERLRWWPNNGRTSLDIRGRGAVWYTPRNPESLLSFQIKEGFHQSKEGAYIEVRHFQECGLFPRTQAQPDGAEKVLDDRDLFRLMALVQTVTVASGFTAQTTSDLPVATLSPPHDLKSTVLVSGSLDRPDSSIVFPFWLNRPFSSYSAFFLYRRIWNDHVTGLIHFRETLDRIESKEEETNQRILDYLVILHLHLVALCIMPQRDESGNSICQAIPTATPIKIIQEALENGKRRFLACVNTSVAQAPQQLNDKKMITADATFYLACALFSSAPMASLNTANWIKGKIFDPLSKRDRAYRESLSDQIWQLISDGQYLPVLETRPEGFALLTGIQNLLSVLDSDSAFMKESGSWKNSIQSSLTNWHKKVGFTQILQYPAHNSRGEWIPLSISSDTIQIESTMTTARILDDSSWWIKTHVPDAPIMSNPKSQGTFEKLESFHNMLMAESIESSINTVASHLLEFVKQGHQEWRQYSNDDQETIMTLVGNCAVELEKRRFLKKAEEIYNHMFIPEQYNNLHAQYAHLLISQERYDEAFRILDIKDESFLSKQVASIRLEIVRKYAQKNKPFEILRTSKTLPNLAFKYERMTEADLSHSDLFYQIVLDRIQTDNTLSDETKLIQSWNVWQVMFHWIKNRTKTEKELYRTRKSTVLRILALFLFNARRATEHAERIKMISKKLLIMLQKNYLNETSIKDLDNIRHISAILFSEDDEKEIATALFLKSYETMSLDPALSFYLSNSLHDLDRPGLAEQVRQGQKIQWENDSTIREYVDNGLKKFNTMVREAIPETPLLESLQEILGQLPPHERDIFGNPRVRT